jgi:hypothetical protein
VPRKIPILKTKKFQDFELQTREMVAPIHPAGVFTNERYGAPSPRGAPLGGGRGSDPYISRFEPGEFVRRVVGRHYLIA